MGLMPPGTKLAANPPDIAKWDTLSDDAKKVLSRQMEVYAGYCGTHGLRDRAPDRRDRRAGRVDNTIVIYIAGDNGGTAIGGLNGTFNEWSNLNGAPEDIPYLLTGSTSTAARSPIRTTRWLGHGRLHAGHLVHQRLPGRRAEPGDGRPLAQGHQGEGRNPPAVHPPHRRGPTILEAVGIPEPKVVNGVEQTPMAGREHEVLLRRREGQGSAHHAVQRVHRQPEHLPRRVAGLRDAPCAVGGETRASTTSPRTSGSCTTSPRISVRPPISPRKYPEKLKEMQDLFHKEAIKYGVYPMDDRSFERLNATNAGRPDIMAGRKEMTLYPGMTGMAENVFIDTLSRSYRHRPPTWRFPRAVPREWSVSRPACSGAGAST